MACRAAARKQPRTPRRPPRPRLPAGPRHARITLKIPSPSTGARVTNTPPCGHGRWDGPRANPCPLPLSASPLSTPPDPISPTVGEESSHPSHHRGPCTRGRVAASQKRRRSDLRRSRGALALPSGNGARCHGDGHAARQAQTAVGFPAGRPKEARRVWRSCPLRNRFPSSRLAGHVTDHAGVEEISAAAIKGGSGLGCGTAHWEPTVARGSTEPLETGDCITLGTRGLG